MWWTSVIRVALVPLVELHTTPGRNSDQVPLMKIEGDNQGTPDVIEATPYGRHPEDV